MIMLTTRVSCRTLSMSCRSFRATKKYPLVPSNDTSNIDRAFVHFDDLYSSVYGTRWPSIRLGLLYPQKYIAIANTFSDLNSSTQKLEALGACDLQKLWDRGKEKQSQNSRHQVDDDDDGQRLEDLEQTLTTITKIKAASLPVPFPTTLKGIDQLQFVPEQHYFAEYAQENTSLTADFSFTTAANAPTIQFPFLRPFVFEGGNQSKFPPPPKHMETGLREWICVNGASLAAIMALDLTPGNNMLDLCAGPGTKSLLALMTLCPVTLTANDVEASRLGRLGRIFLEFTGTATPPTVRLTNQDATNFSASPDFDRVLADVPCSSDRRSATVSDKSLYQPKRLKERMHLPKTQKAILVSALRSLSRTPGSVCVYSTCTLSPIENDGVVGTALQETGECDLVVDVEGLWKCLLPLQTMNLMVLSRTKFGVLIVPNTVANCGPMFISRMLRRRSPSHQVAQNKTIF